MELQLTQRERLKRDRNLEKKMTTGGLTVTKDMYIILAINLCVVVQLSKDLLI